MQAATIESQLTPDRLQFYQRGIDLLTQAQLPFLVGGAFALERYTGIPRYTKDLDLFVRARDCRRILDEFTAQGYAAEMTFPHWLAKVRTGDSFIDIIFNSGNGIAEVDDGWFAHAVETIVLDRRVLVCPVEESIWTRAFVMERERYDGADIAHLLQACAARLDWRRLLDRFGEHWRLLLSHLILFGYIYPAEQDQVPAWVLNELLSRLSRDMVRDACQGPVCQGTMLSREQYLIDVWCWGYQDARLAPHGHLSPQAVAQWTAAIGSEAESPKNHQPGECQP
jgi:hypothetical protein